MKIKNLDNISYKYVLFVKIWNNLIPFWRKQCNPHLNFQAQHLIWKFEGQKYLSSLVMTTVISSRVLVSWESVNHEIKIRDIHEVMESFILVVNKISCINIKGILKKIKMKSEGTSLFNVTALNGVTLEFCWSHLYIYAHNLTFA